MVKLRTREEIGKDLLSKDSKIQDPAMVELFLDIRDLLIELVEWEEAKRNDR